MVLIGLLGAVACTAIACGGGLEGDHSAATSEELKWGPGWIPGQIPSTGPVPEGCVRTEGEQIGQNVTLRFSGLSLAFTGWTNKTGQSGKFVGFAFAASGSVAYAVKAGLETFYGTASSWTHPAGLSGSQAKAISNITFCRGAPSGGGSPGDGGTPSASGAGAGATCAVDADCWSGECGAGNVCGRGGAGTRCEDGARDCVSGICSNGVCAPNPTGTRGDPCNVDAECWSGGCVSSTCQGGQVGESCRDSTDCFTGLICGPASTCATP